MRVFTRVIRLRAMVNLYDSTLCLTNSPLELIRGQACTFIHAIRRFVTLKKRFKDIQKSADMEINNFISAGMKSTRRFLTLFFVMISMYL